MRHKPAPSYIRARVAGVSCPRRAPDPLPVLTPEQLARFAPRIFAQLVSLVDTIAEKETAHLSLITAHEYLNAKNLIRLAARWSSDEQQLIDADAELNANYASAAAHDERRAAEHAAANGDEVEDAEELERDFDPHRDGWVDSRGLP